MRPTKNSKSTDDAFKYIGCASQLLDGLSPKAASELKAAKQTTSYSAGVPIFAEGQSPQGIYMLCRGQAKLVLSGEGKRAQIIKVAEPGEVLGLSAAIANQPHEVTFETLTPCWIDFISRTKLLRLLHEQPEICFRVVQLLGQTLHESYEQFCLFEDTPSAATKLAYVLLNWCAEGEENIEGIRLKMPLTHKAIAHLIGTSRETVTRTLGEFKNRQIISIEGATLLVHDLAALQAIQGSRCPKFY